MERVRARLLSGPSAGAAAGLPSGYERWGPVLVLRLSEALRPHFASIAEAYRAELGVRAVWRRAGFVEGEERAPRLELLSGERADAEAVEYGVRYRFDPECLLFARGNRTERARAGRLTRSGEIVADLFAGIGYFVLPALVRGRAARALAVEKNPVAYRYLIENARRNAVADRLDARLGDNRLVPLETGTADRVFLGYLPSAVPWVRVALPLLRRTGGDLHVHLLLGTRERRADAEARVAEAVDAAGGRVERTDSRSVKPYGPGREHVVVDARARPAPPSTPGQRPPGPTERMADEDL